MIHLQSSIHHFKTWLWKSTSKNETVFLRQLRTILQIICALFYDLKQGQLSLRAMSLVYTTILSIVPVIAISFSVLKGLGVHNQLTPFLLSTLEPLGDKRFEVTEKIIGFVDKIQVGVLGVVGLAILIYTVVGMMQKIEHSFNFVWRVQKARSIGARLNDYLSVLLIAPLLMFISTAMTATVRNHSLLDHLSVIPMFETFSTLFGVVLPYMVLAIAFTFLYSFIPNTKVTFKAALIGGIVTAFLWKIMGWGFANFVSNSSGKTAIYAAFATVLIFMIWIYLIWLMLLIGASISFYVQHPNYRRPQQRHEQLTPSLLEQLVVDIITYIAKCFQNNKPSPRSSDIAKHIKQPLHHVEHALILLESHHLIAKEEKHQGYLPAKPLEKISLYDLLHCARQSHNTTTLGKQVDATLKKSFSKQTLDKMA